MGRRDWERKRRTAALLAALFALQALAGTASGATEPPQEPGDWTINWNETAYLNSSDQALVQGDLHIYGSLVIDDGNLFFWGSSDGERVLNVYEDGSLTLRNGGRIGSYNAQCYGITVHPRGSILAQSSTINNSCEIRLESNNMTFEDMALQNSPLYLYPGGGGSVDIGTYDSVTGTRYGNWTFDGLEFEAMTRVPVMEFYNNPWQMDGWSATFRDIGITVLDTGTYGNDINIDNYWAVGLVFDGLDVTTRTTTTTTTTTTTATTTTATTTIPSTTLL